jgi:isoleucyl-tRNA synthetase
LFARVWSGSLPEIAQADALLAKWQRILAIRAVVQKELETVRQQGSIGSSLEAEVTIAAPDEDYAALASLGDDLRFVMITSAARVERADTLAIAVNRSAHSKCERCWHWRDDVGNDSRHPTLCGRCVANLFGAGEARSFA